MRRGSIAGLMALILILAAELALLRDGSEGSAKILVNLSVALLIAAAFLARYRHGGEGAWWFGFAVFGWGHLALVELFDDYYAAWDLITMALNLISRETLERLWPKSLDSSVIIMLHALATQFTAALGGVVGIIAHRMLAPAQPRGESSEIV